MSAGSIRLDRRSHRIFKKALQLEGDVKRNTTAALYQAGFNLVRKHRMGVERGGKSGTLIVHGPGAGKQASAPGEYPQIRTGKYIRAIDFEVRGTTQMEYGVRDVDYAKFLEFGTDKMKPRAGVQTTFDTLSGEVLTFLERAIQGAYEGR